MHSHDDDRPHTWEDGLCIEIRANPLWHAYSDTNLTIAPVPMKQMNLSVYITRIH